MRTDSSLFEQFTLGIEEEFQIVDPNTRSADDQLRVWRETSDVKAVVDR